MAQGDTKDNFDESLRKLKSRGAGKRLSRFVDAMETATDTPSVYKTMLVLYVDRMDEYIGQTREQAEKSFTQAKYVSWAGFVLIAIGVVVGLISLFFKDVSNALWVSVITTSSGVIIEITAGTFFVIFNRSLSQFMKVTSLLMEMQHSALSLMCVETMDESDKKDAGKASLIEKILAKKFPLEGSDKE